MKNKIVIKSLVSNKGLFDSDGTVEVRYIVGSDNQISMLQQELILTNDGTGWIAQMPMDDFPSNKTITSSALKLAEWMERMAAAIKEHKFSQIELNNL